MQIIDADAKTYVLPFEIGGDIWYLDEENGFQIEHEKGGIKGAAIFEDGTVLVIDRCGEMFTPGTSLCCTSREEAEAIREQMTLIIYKVTNKTDGKVYIGKTKRTLEARWKQHCRDSNSRIACFKLHGAIKEFGAENFTVEQIDCAATEEEANAKEVYWISAYNATEDGYNVSPGGRAGGSRKKVMAVESGLIFDTMVEAARHYGLSHSMIPQVVDKPHLTAGGQHWISVKKD